MKTEPGISRERNKFEAGDKSESTVHGHVLADSPGGKDEFWIELRRREFGVSATLAHILADRQMSSHPGRRPEA